MKKYKVIFHSDAETDINSSFEWGCRTWGQKSAEAWIRQLYRTIRDRLTAGPLACSLAPESEELGIPLRQLLVRRYRILFIVDKKTDMILHVKGSYTGQIVEDPKRSTEF